MYIIIEKYKHICDTCIILLYLIENEIKTYPYLVVFFHKQIYFNNIFYKQMI